jgi:ubiquinone/menaquinone biosynthesis C-methylase UbiE
VLDHRIRKRRTQGGCAAVRPAASTPQEIYTQGEYLEKNPTWHTEDSLWKAQNIVRIMQRNGVMPETICEVGCGAGEILAHLQRQMARECRFWGYEISPQAYALCQGRANERLSYILGDVVQDEGRVYDLILLIDVIEHMEDYFGFLRRLKRRSRYKILHIPLEVSAQSVLRRGKLVESWELVGHIHYFTKETALRMLKSVGYEVLDYFYTPFGVERPAPSIKSRIARIPRKLLFRIHEDLAVRILGGCSLMVLGR